MATIEERVSKACVTLGYAMLYSDVTSPCLIAKSDAIYIVEEQDRIARQEERERCIKKACEWLTDSLYAFVSYDENDGIGLKIDYTQLTKMLRKELEG